MQWILRRRKLVWLMLLIFVIGLPIWLTVSAVRQQRLDQALITAIKRREPRSVAYLLSHGANPNTLDTPKTSVSMWQLLLESLRGKQTQRTAAPTALQAAIRVDLDSTLPPQQEQSYAIIRALLARGAAAPSDPVKAAISLGWAKRRLKQAPDRPRMSEDSDTPYFILKDAEQAVKDILLKYGPSAQAYTELAECRSRQGRYQDAVHAYRLASLWLPGSVVIQTKQQRIEELLQVSQSVANQLPPGDSVLYVRPYPVEPGKRIWAILTGHTEEDKFHQSYFRNYSNVHLALYAQREHEYEMIWQSGRIWNPQLVGYGAVPDFNDVQLAVFDMAGNGVPQLVIQEIFYGASWIPSHMDIFAWQHGRMVHILDVSSSEPLWIEDINHDGRYEVRNLYEIGQMYHAAQPRWSDIYAYKHGKFVHADRDFPAQFADWPGKLQSVLKQFPDDYSILKYLAYTYEIERHPQKSLATYREAERACANQLNDELNKQVRADLFSELRQIRGRIHTLVNPKT